MISDWYEDRRLQEPIIYGQVRLVIVINYITFDALYLQLYAADHVV